MDSTPAIYVKYGCRYCTRPAYVKLNGRHHGTLDLCHSHLELFRLHGGAWTGNRMMRSRGALAKAGVV